MYLSVFLHTFIDTSVKQLLRVHFLAKLLSAYCDSAVGLCLTVTSSVPGDRLKMKPFTAMFTTDR